MATRKNEWLASIKPILDREEAKRDAKELAKELGDLLEINIDASPENLKQLTDEFNKQLSQMGKQPIVFSEKTLHGIVGQFANAVAEGIVLGVGIGVNKTGVEGLGSGIGNAIGGNIANGIVNGVKDGITASSVEITKQLDTLTKRRVELHEQSAKLDKRLSKYEKLSEISSMEYDEFKPLPLSKDGDIDEQAQQIMGAFVDAEDALNEATRGTKEYNNALIKAMEAAEKLYRMSHTLSNNRDLVRDKTLLSDFDFLNLSDLTADVFDKADVDFAKFLRGFDKYYQNQLQMITTELNQIETKMESLQKQQVEIVNEDKTKASLKSVKEIEDAYSRILKKEKSVDKAKEKIGSSVEYVPGSESLTVLSNRYKKSLSANEDWETQYQWLVKFVKEYEDYSKQIAEESDGLKRRNMRARQRRYDELYENLKPVAGDAENALRGMLDVADGKPLGDKGAGSNTGAGTTPDDVANAEKIAEAKRKAAEEEAKAKVEAEAKAKVEKEAAEAAKQKRIEEEKAAKAAEKKRLADEAAAEAQRKAAEDAERERLAKEAAAKAETSAPSLSEVYDKAPDEVKKKYQEIVALQDQIDEFESKAQKIAIDMDPWNATKEQKDQIVAAWREYQKVIQEIAAMPIVETEDDEKRLLELKAKAVSLYETMHQGHLNDVLGDGYAKEYGLSVAEGKQMHLDMQDTPRKDFDKSLDNLKAKLYSVYGEAQNLSAEIFNMISSASSDELGGVFEKIRQDALAAKPAVEAVGDAHQSVVEAIQTETQAEKDLQAIKKVNIGLASTYAKYYDQDVDSSDEFMQGMANKNKDKLLSLLGADPASTEQDLKAWEQEIQSRLTSVNESVSRMSKLSAVPKELKTTEELYQEAAKVSQRISTMYDEGITDTEEYIALQHKLVKLFDTIAGAYGGVKGSGAKDRNELNQWMYRSMKDETGFDYYSSHVTDALYEGPNSLYNSDGKKKSMRDQAADLLGYKSDVFEGSLGLQTDIQNLKEIEVLLGVIEKRRDQLFDKPAIATPDVGAGTGNASSAELEAAVTKTETLQDEVEQKNKELADKDAEIARVRAENEAKLKTEADEKDGLQADLNATNQQLADVKHENELYDTALAKANEESNVKDGIIRELREQLANVKTGVSEEQASVSSEELKNVLSSIVYNVKIAHDDNDKTANKIALDEGVLESTLKRVFTNVLNPHTEQNDSEPKNEPWALEKTLQTVKGVLDNIQTNTAKPESVEVAPAKVEVGNVLATESTLAAIKTAIEAINSKISGKISGVVKSESDKPAKILTEKKKHKDGTISHGAAEGESGSMQKLFDYYYWIEEQIEQFKNNELYVAELQKVQARIVPKLVDYYKELEASGKEDPAWIAPLNEKHNLHMSKIRGGEMQSDAVSTEKKALDLLKEEYKLKREIFTLEQKGATRDDIAPLQEKLGIYQSIREALEINMTDDELLRYATAATKEVDKGEHQLTVKQITANIQTRKAEAAQAANAEKEWIKLEKQYHELGVLQAREEAEQTKTAKERVAQLQQEISSKQESLNLSKKELDALEQIAEEARAKEFGILGAKKSDKDEKKRIADEKKYYQKQAMVGKAGNAVGRAENTWMSAIALEADGNDAIPEEFKIQVDEYRKRLEDLRKKQEEVRNTAVPVTDAQKQAFEQQTQELINQINGVNRLTDEIGGLVAEYQKLSGANVDETKAQATTLGAQSPLSDYETQLKQYVASITHGKGQIKSFNAETKTLTYIVKTGKNEFTEYTAAVRHLDHQMVAVQGTTTRTETFFEATARKMKELTSYFSGMAIFSRIGQELRRGIQYVREIDLALTELRKVTDETEETYDKFLDTAAKTADKVGSTIQKVVSSTADWARLGSILANTNIRPII